MNLYVMRHGTTVWNEWGIFQGRTNNRLSKNGIALTKEAAKSLKDVPLNIIVCSRLMRTMQTANIMNEPHRVKVVKDDNLLEIDQGIFTGRRKDSLTPKEQRLNDSRSKAAGMETYEECYARAKEFVETIKERYPYENVLAVTHNCTATFIEDVICRKKEDFGDSKFLRNFKTAEVKKFEL